MIETYSTKLIQRVHTLGLFGVYPQRALSCRVLSVLSDGWSVAIYFFPLNALHENYKFFISINDMRNQS